MSLKQKIKHELDKINALKQIKDILTSTILNSMRHDYATAKSSLPLIKDLLLDIVDDIWRIGKKTFKNIADLESAKFLDQKSTRVLPEKLVSKRYKSSFNIRETDKKPKENSATSFEKVNRGEVLSEFSYSNGPSFSKSIREIDKKVTITPGPACYYIEKSKDEMKNKAPIAVFPTVTKRDSYIPVSYSPGPAKYYSSIRFIAKA